jgi:hypothetical protein
VEWVYALSEVEVGGTVVTYLSRGKQPAVAEIEALTGSHFIEILYGCERQFMTYLVSDVPFFWWTMAENQENQRGIASAQ